MNSPVSLTQRTTVETHAVNAPKVAVVMTVHNGFPYLPEAMGSIFNQSYSDYEFIVVNDGSSDETASYLDSLDDPRLQVVHQPRGGQNRAAHRAILAATAQYVARMDCDDVADSGRLAKQVAFLDANPEVGLLGSQITRRGETGSGLQSRFPTKHDAIVADLIHNRHSMCNPATMFRRQLYLDTGGYWEHNIAEDWDMFLRIGERSKLANLDEALLSYRFHTTSINGRRTIEAQLFNEYAACLSKRRIAGQPEISINEFLASHRSRRFPTSITFRLDCYSLAQYRKAVAEIHSGKKILGSLRAAYSIVCSPPRALRRMKMALFGG